MSRGINGLAGLQAVFGFGARLAPGDRAPGRTVRNGRIARPNPEYESCYACDAGARGFRDRRPEGGALEPACARHADPSIEVYDACIYCGEPVRKGSRYVDGGYAHAACDDEAQR